MYCPRCGDTNHECDRFCSSCGQDLVTYRQLWAGSAPPATGVAAPSAPQTWAAAHTAPVGAPSAAQPWAAPQPPATSLTNSPAAPVQAAMPATAPAPAIAPGAVSGIETPQIASYLGWAAVLVALCWPAFWAGVAALVYAGRTESRLAAGDLAGAREASRKAKAWCWVTFIAGALLWVVALALLIAL